MRKIPAGKPTILGVDVSKWQGKIDWSSVAQAGAKFGFARVSDGTKHVDATFEANWQGMKDAGIHRGAYQFVRVNVPVDEQVAILCEKLEAGDFGPEDLPPVCDIEAKGKSSSTEQLKFVLDWCDLVEKNLNRRPIIYSYPYFWQAMTTRSNAYPLWIAHYQTSAPLVPSSWENWVFWQTTGEGRFPGIRGNADLNLFNGSEEKLLEFIADSHLKSTWRRQLMSMIGWNLRRMSLKP